jgi:hypothetical protein
VYPKPAVLFAEMSVHWCVAPHTQHGLIHSYRGRLVMAFVMGVLALVAWATDKAKRPGRSDGQ